MSVIQHLVPTPAALRTGLYSFAFLRSVLYTAESFMGPAIELAVNRRRPRLPTDDPNLFRLARASIEELLKRDVDNIVNGLYPIEVLAPENPVAHLKRIPAMFREGLAIAKRRKSHEAHSFSKAAQELMSDLPEYYQRNFHYQGDGYLSERSARLYEHQVEILFAGAADAMRRLIIPHLREKFGNGDGEGLSFLEIGAGTGRATKFVRLAFPKAKIVAVDLSAPYLKKAQRTLAGFARHDFVEADGTQLPYLDETFDAVYSVFLFHELPAAERERMIRENLRVLKKGGFIGLVDSLQLGDAPEFDQALQQFPQEFHEPFYKNYIQKPMRDVFETCGVGQHTSTLGFFSKALSGRKGE